MMPLDETKRPSLDLAISLLATKTPDGTQFSRRNELSSLIPLELPSLLPANPPDQEHFRTHVYGVLDVLSRVVLTDCKQVAAVAASVAPPSPGSEKIHTTLYLSLNPGNGPSTAQMTARIRDIISDLKNFTDPAVSDASQSPMITTISTEFMATFYSYGWKRFQYYYHKRIERLPEASRLLEQFKVDHTKSTFFGPEHLEHLDLTLWWLGNLERVIQMHMSDEGRSFKLAALVAAQQYGRFKGLIGGEESPLNKLFMVYDIFEKYLKLKHNFIPIIRWVTKLCSLHIDLQRLVALATSLRFRCILFGDLHIKIYHQEAPRKQRIKCNDKVLLETVVYLRQKFESSNGQGKDEQTLTDDDIVKKLKRELAKGWGKYFNPGRCVHCEVFLLRSIQTAGVPILPYIGVSKLSCVPCSVYFEHQNAVGFRPVSTKGSYGKVYPGWSFPSGGVDDEQLSDLQTRVRDHLENYLWLYIDVIRSRRDSDSSVGSNGWPKCLIQQDLEGLSEEVFFTNEKWAASVVQEL